MRALRTLVRRLLIVLATLYLLAALGLVWLRFFRPVVTMVQVQRAVEAALGPASFRHRATWVEIESLPRHVPRAVVAAEDSRFFQHHGFDWVEIRDAIGDTEAGRPRGASTLTQQLIKNLYFTTHRSPVRKGAELLLTPAAELILPKERILELYLNVVEWGPGIYGIEEAARHHYRVPAQSLTREQAARLAAILPAPLRRRPASMSRYTSIILQRMRALGW